MTLFDCIKNPYYKHKYVLERIIMHLLAYTRTDLIIHYDDLLEETTLECIHTMYDQYALEHQPLEYILGFVEYGWLSFSVNQDTIIPRPETEYMIDAVREYLSQKNDQKVSLVDVGTWSGVLWLSLLYSHGFSINTAFLIDISIDALTVAKENYLKFIDEKKINKKIPVVIELWNLLSFPSSVKIESSCEVVIVANLPYIPDETFDTNPDQSIKYEPRVAFVWWNDWLDLYRIMFRQVESKDFLNNNCNPLVSMFLEMMTWQIDVLKKEFEWLSFEEIATFHFQIRIVKVVLV